MTDVSFTSSGSWEVPAGVTSIDVIVVGGGGGGRGGRRDYGGGGGSAGTINSQTSVSVTPGQTISITIGSAGSGGAQDGGNGGNGGQSVFNQPGEGTDVSANGGDGATGKSSDLDGEPGQSGYGSGTYASAGQPGTDEPAGGGGPAGTGRGAGGGGGGGSPFGEGGAGGAGASGYVLITYTVSPDKECNDTLLVTLGETASKKSTCADTLAVALGESVADKSFAATEEILVTLGETGAKKSTCADTILVALGESSSVWLINQGEAKLRIDAATRRSFQCADTIPVALTDWGGVMTTASDDLLVTVEGSTLAAVLTTSLEEILITLGETIQKAFDPATDVLTIYKRADTCDPPTREIPVTADLEVLVTETTRRPAYGTDEILATLGETASKKFFCADTLPVSLGRATKRTWSVKDWVRVKLREIRTLSSSPTSSDVIKIETSGATRKAHPTTDDIQVDAYGDTVSIVVTIVSQDTIPIVLEDATLRSFGRTDSLPVMTVSGSRRPAYGTDEVLVVLVEGTGTFDNLVQVAETISVLLGEAATLPVHQTRVTFLRATVRKTRTLYAPIEEEEREEE